MKYIKYYSEINEGFLDDAWDWMKDNAHLLLPIAEIGSMFIPVIGPFLAMGIGLGDAALYAKEGDKTSAGISAAFSLLPGIGMIAKKIPGVKQLGKEGMEQLGKKLATGETKALTKTEQDVIKSISENPQLIQKGLRKEAEHKVMQKFDPKCVMTAVAESRQWGELVVESKGPCSMHTKKMLDLAIKDPDVLRKFAIGVSNYANDIKSLGYEIPRLAEKYPTNAIAFHAKRANSIIDDVAVRMRKDLPDFIGSDADNLLKWQKNYISKITEPSYAKNKGLSKTRYAEFLESELEDAGKLVNKTGKRYSDLADDAASLKDMSTPVKPRIALETKTARRMGNKFYDGDGVHDYMLSLERNSNTIMRNNPASKNAELINKNMKDLGDHYSMSAAIDPDPNDIRKMKDLLSDTIGKVKASNLPEKDQFMRQLSDLDRIMFK